MRRNNKKCKSTYDNAKSALWRPPYPAFGLLPFFPLRATTEEFANAFSLLEQGKYNFIKR